MGKTYKKAKRRFDDEQFDVSENSVTKAKKHEQKHINKRYDEEDNDIWVGSRNLGGRNLNR